MVKRLTHSEVTKCLYDLRVRGEWFNNPTYIDLVNQLAIIEKFSLDERVNVLKEGLEEKDHERKFQKMILRGKPPQHKI
tara:strand:- start:171 stop:407 length:237 start_codon:yes stop_codon:yes gene_type:complete